MDTTEPLLPKCEICNARGCALDHSPPKRFKKDRTIFKKKAFRNYLNENQEVKILDAAEGILSFTRKSFQDLLEKEKENKEIALGGLDAIEGNQYNNDESE